jgi:nucleotide-binding universal stress UspA family protein
MSIQVRRILVPLDHSGGSDAVVEYACAVARGLASTLTLMHVYEPPSTMVGIVPGASVGGDTVAEYDAGIALLDHAAMVVRANGFDKVERILERASSSSHAIVNHARAGAFDLIVMGTHGRSGFKHLVMGSVAEQVIRTTSCPILLVHLVMSGSPHAGTPPSVIDST